MQKISQREWEKFKNNKTAPGMLLETSYIIQLTFKVSSLALMDHEIYNYGDVNLPVEQVVGFIVVDLS